MKNLSVIICLSLLPLAAPAALPQPDLLVQIYFAGAQKISADARAGALTNEFSSPEALALRTETAAKLSRCLAGWLPANANAAVPDGAARLRPLFDDLQRSEFALQIWSSPGGPSETAILIKLDPARARLWEANLRPLFPAATFQANAGWLAFDSNPALLKAGDKLARLVANSNTNWLDLFVNWPQLGRWHPLLEELALPTTEFHVKESGGALTTIGKFTFPANLALHLDPWRVPTNSLHAPFDSFTAVRGFADWLQSQSWAQAWQLSPSPNQLFLWSLPTLPFQTYAAAPVPNAAAAISQVYAHWQAAIKAARDGGELLTPAKVEKNRGGDVVISGLPFVSVRAQPLSEPAGQFLFAELFPNPPHGLPLPQGLFNRLATPNLVFYHWENTAERIPQLLQITQLSLMLSEHRQLDGKCAAYKWLRKAGAAPGASETGITQTGPAELTFLRQGPGLFTAMELFTLANWLNAPDFPGCDLKAPPRPNRPATASAAMVPRPAAAPKPAH